MFFQSQSDLKIFSISEYKIVHFNLLYIAQFKYSHILYLAN